jgi:hypothetical protein
VLTALPAAIRRVRPAFSPPSGAFTRLQSTNTRDQSFVLCYYIDPQDALAAMREIRQNIVKVCGQLRTLLQEPAPNGQLRDTIADMVAYSEQLQFLYQQYCDGQN